MKKIQSANSKKVLIIGGTGFIGPELVKLLLTQNYNVTLLNRGTHILEDTEHLKADRNKYDDMRDAAALVDQTVDAIIDLSCYNETQARLAWNFLSPYTNHWIYLSSASVYKNPIGAPPKETDLVGGADIWGSYGVEKSQAEQFLLTSSDKVESPKVTIFRPSYIYGPGNNHDRETFIWVRALNNLPVFIPGNGKTSVQFLHVTDIAHAFLAALRHLPETNSAIYNVTGDEIITLKKWTSLLSKIAQTEDIGVVTQETAKDYLPIQYFPLQDYVCWADNKKIKAALGWTTIYSIEEGFFQTFQSYPLDQLKSFPIRTIDQTIEKEIAAKIELELSH